MAKSVYTNAGVYFSGYGLSGYLNSVELSMARDAVEVTSFGDSVRNHIPGLSINTIAASGFYDATLVDAVADANIPSAAEDLVIVAPTRTAGDRAYILAAQLNRYTLGASIGDALEATFAWGSRDDMVAGYLQNTPATTITATGNGSAVQLGALGADEELWAAVTTIAAPTGTSPTFDLIVESDDNGAMSSATTRATFSQITSSRTHAIQRIAGAVTDDYWRMSWTVGGTTPVYAVAMAFGIVKKNLSY